MTTYQARDLESLFRNVLGGDWQTRLEGGAEEPLYLPAMGEDPARILYTRDYFRSALHEIAHWCIAGERRRRERDYGYWYAPDGRDRDQQRRFLRVEEKSQALELLFCAACGHEFLVSLDNLDGQGSDTATFEETVIARARKWLDGERMPSRAHIWVRALTRHYGRAVPDLDTVTAVFRRLS